MSGTRFARTGRCRFLVCFGILVLMVGMVVIFHSSQIQLDETREQRLHCEQQQEALNERLTSLVEQKFHLEKNQERERTEFLETKRNLEQKIKNIDEKYQKEQVENQMRYEKLEQAHTLLQNKHMQLKDENMKANKQQLDNINGLETKVQSLKSELKKEKSNKSGEVYMWKEKYNTAEQDAKQHLERFKELEMQLKEYQSHCDWKPNGDLVQRNPVAPKPNVSDNISPSTSQKTFNLQEPVSEGIYRIVVNTSSSSNKDKLMVNNTNNNRIENGIDDGVGGVRPRDLDGTKNQSFSATKQEIMQIPNTNPVFKPLITKHYNGSLILNSVENFQIVPKIIKRIPDEEESVIEAQPLAENNKNQVAPLGAPKHKSSSSATKSEPQMAAAAASNATLSNIRTGRESGRSSTSNSPPLAVPPKQKKLPENVAPYPENFEDLLQKSNNEQSKNGDVHETKNTGNAKASPLKSSNNNQNYDFGGVGDHDAKNMDNMNDDSNLPNEDLNNFFDTDNDSPKDHHNKQKNLDDTVNNDDDDGGIMAGDNEGDGGAAAGDIAVKHNQQLLDDTLKNEIAEDQGKEFGDGLRLDEGEGGALEEDDDDDYSNPSAARKKAEAIRH